MLSVHLEDGRVSIENVPRPQRPPGFALIRLRCAGICNTDLELQRGYYGFRGTPGHEFTGEVIEADNPELAGKRVTGEINLGCLHCKWCRQGLDRHCPHRTVLGIVKHPGAFSEFLTLPERNLHLLPDSLDDEAAVFTEPLAAACEILDQVAIPCSSPVAVLGDGKLGLLVAQMLQAHSYKVHLFGHHAEKLRIAADAGVHTEIAAKLPQAAYDWVVEATGSPDGLNQAVAMVKPRGTIIMKSTIHGLAGFDTAPVIVNEVTLVGSRCGRFEPALALLEKNVVQTRPMIAERLPLSEAPRAFALAARKGVLKVLLENPR